MVTQAARGALGGVVVAPMRRRHLRGVLAIERMVYPRAWSQRMFASELEQPETRRYVVALALRRAGAPGHPVDAEPDARPEWPGLRRVVGYSGVMVQAGEAHITTVAVHPRHHRQKIATRLLIAILSEARALEAQSATLEVRVANRGAQRLYAGFGFAPVGVRRGYYTETGEDALIMWLHDLQGPATSARLSEQVGRLTAPGGASGAPDIPVPWVRGRVGLGRDGGP